MLPRIVYQQAKDPKTSPQKLVEIANQRNLILRRRLAQNPAVPSKTLEDLLYPHDAIVWRFLAKNPSSTSRMMQVVGRVFQDELLENPALPLLVLEDPGFLERTSLLYYLIKSKKAPPQLLEASAADLSKNGYRFVVARNLSTPPACLARLTQDDDPEVSSAAQQNPNTPKEALAFLQRIKRETLTEEEQNQATPSRYLSLLLAQNPHTPDALVVSLFNRGPLNIKRAILRRQQLPQQLFELSDEPLPATLAELFAKHPQTPVNLLEALFARANKTTEERGILYGLAKNPRLPEHIIDELIAQNLSFSLVFNPRLTQKHLQKILTGRFMTETQGKEAQRAAVQHPNAPRWLLELYQRIGFEPISRRHLQPEPKISPEDEATLLSLSGFTRGIVARNRRTGEDVLRSLAASGVEFRYPRIELLKGLGVPHYLLEEIARDPVERRLVFHSPSAPPELLFDLWSDVEPFRRFVSSNKPHHTREVFECLARAYNTEGRCIAARNKYLPEKLRDAFVFDRFPVVREAIAERADLQPAQVKRLLQDLEPKVRAAASLNPNAPQAYLSFLQRCGASDDLTEFAPPDLSITPEDLSRLARGSHFAKLLAARHPNTPAEALHRLALTETKVGAYIMRHPNTSEKTLLSIAKRKYRVLHLAMLKRPKLSEEILFYLMGSHDADIRRRAAARPDAHNLCQLFYTVGASKDLEGFSTFDETIPSEILARFGGGGLYVQQLAARHSNTNPVLLGGFLVSMRPSLRAHAAQNPSSPQDVIRLLQKIGASDDLSEMEAPDEDATEEDFEAAQKLGPFGNLLASLMRPLLA